MRESDGKLLERYVAGEQCAFDELYSRYAGLVYNVCLRRLRNAPDSEDAAAATFAVLARKAGKLSRRRNLAGWIQWCATNAARNLVRAKRRRERHEEEAARMRVHASSRGAGWKKVMPLLDEALASLPEAQRSVVVMCYMQGRSLREVSAEMRCPEGTTATRARLALGKLRRRLGRRGVTLTATTLAGMLTEHSCASPPPANLPSKIKNLLESPAAGGAPVAAAGAGVRAMPAIKAKLVAGVLATVTAAGGGFAAHRLLAGERSASGRAKLAFAAKPTVSSEGKNVRIKFEATRSAPVSVEIVDGEGKVVCHLAAGMLGEHAPAPLEKNKLAQSLLWDRTDDDGRPASGRLKLRVGLGLTARYAGEYGGGKDPAPGMKWDGRHIDNMRAITSGPDGTVYMLGGWWHPHTDRFPHLIALDRDGEYLREVYPPPAQLIPEKTPGMPSLKLADGTHIPQVQSWWDLFIPAMTGAGKMVATPDGHLLLATTAKDYVKTRRALLKIGCDGSIPADAWKLKLPPGMATVGFSMAAGPDSKFLYVSGTKTTRPATMLHCVYRLALDGGNKYELFFGEEKKAGKDDKHLDHPSGVTVDANGNVYVADHKNNRVLVLKPDRSVLRKIEVQKPFALKVDPRSGAIYVLTADWKLTRNMHHAVNRKLVKFSSEGKQLAAVDVSVKGGYRRVPMRFGGMGIDVKGEKPVLWIGTTTYPDGCNGYPFGYEYGLVKVTDTGAGLSKPEVVDMSGAVVAARRKKRSKWSRHGSVQRDGYRYSFKCKQPTWKGVGWLVRRDAKGQEAPFPAAGKGKWPELLGRPQNRSWGRVLVNYQKDVLVEYYNRTKKDATAGIDLIAPDGKVKKREFVSGLREGTFGLKVDRKGCVYVADHFLPPGRAVPAEIEKSFAAAGKKPGRTYTSSYGSIFKMSPKGGGFSWGKAAVGGKAAAGDLVRKPGAVWEPSLKRTAACSGVLWQFVGGSPLPAYKGKCICTGIGFDLDGHGRLYVPDAYRMCVHVLDTDGNYLLRIGKYGNQDDAKGEIAFARPRFASAGERQVTVTDPQNGKATRIDLLPQVEGVVEIR